jgi:hypothetical protein
MKTIVVDDVTARWIDEVKTAEGLQGWDHGEPVMCDDATAILHMHVAWIQIRKVREAIR